MSLISWDLEATLLDAGAEVHCALSCKEALDWLERHEPDLAIIDIGLRDGRCTEVALALLRAAIPFIVHSGDQQAAYMSTPFELGVWLTKPSPPAALIQAVNAMTMAYG